MYKALALAYERALSDESWRIAYNRISELVFRIENLLSRSELLGFNVESIFKNHSIRILKAVEEGDAASVVRIYGELDRDLKNIELRVSVAYTYVVLARITATLITMGVGVVLALKLLNMLVSTLLAILSIGVALGSLLLVVRRNAHITLIFSIILQLGSILSYASYNLREAISLSWLALISLTSITALMGVHLLAERIKVGSPTVYRKSGASMSS